MNEQVSKVVIGATGLSGSVVAPDIISSVSADSGQLVNVIVQLIIGVATLIGLFKRKKN